MTHQACLFTLWKFYFERIPWEMAAQINSETRVAILVLHKVNHSCQKIRDTLEFTQAAAIFVFRSPTSQSNSLGLTLINHSVQMIFKRRFWKSETRSLRMPLWLLDRNLRESVCKYFWDQIWSCILVLENSGYRTDHSSYFVRVVSRIHSSSNTKSRTFSKQTLYFSQNIKCINSIQFNAYFVMNFISILWSGCFRVFFRTHTKKDHVFLPFY